MIVMNPAMTNPATLSVGISSISSLLIPKAYAHQTEIAADVGATLHIEPNDIPRAGQANLTWFALSRRGGEPIPLDACDCTLMVYDASRPTEATEAIEAIATPVLEPVSAEGYEAIPGAEILFPAVGAYDLVLQGQPTTPGDFQPFEFRFQVTVAAAANTAASTADNTAVPQSDPPDPPTVASSESTPTTDEETASKETASEETAPGAIASETTASAPGASSQAVSQGSETLMPALLGVGIVAVMAAAVLWWRQQASSPK